ncbi:FAD-binding monooxygenase [Hymenobacter sp. RP-2-7]|uniref:FAD-binding monooxygenase n=1 Tax=Hymenobacter polaris TaxID=2682546 RepID=A0A7Y0FNM5_9BACT|nr:FAD-dependent monooxygenase [Hymenobacter polaris]NML66736.1 FAD-binding monooxygenase [Hymenobacter polaris]
MDSQHAKTALVSGASIAGLATAYWLSELGYRVTVVELAAAPRTGGGAVNVGGPALDSIRRMGLYEQLKPHALHLDKWEFKNADDTTAGTMTLGDGPDGPPAEDLEIERYILIPNLLGAIRGEVEYLFDNRITALREAAAGVQATLADGTQRTFDLVVGCDGVHSGVRKLWFGHETEYAHFLHYYFSLTSLDKPLMPPATAQLYNVPGKVVMVMDQGGKTDVAFCFYSEHEIAYDYRDTAQQAAIVAAQFAGEGWRTTELLAEVAQQQTAYFDKFAQIRMPAWTKGRVALVGDAAYCATAAAGQGGALALAGATALADALRQHNGNIEAALPAYDHALRPYVEEVQDMALVMLSEYLVPRTEAGIQKRNAGGIPF